MRKGDTLHGRKGAYTILKDFEVTGGMSKVSFAKLESDGNIYFIKEFLSPKLSSSGSPATIEKKKKKCAEFEAHHHKINKEISKKSSLGGNLISAFDFFRNGTTYFKVCEKVDISSISISAVSKLPFHQRLLIIRTIVSSLKILHDLEIVHGDLKQDNILIKKISDEKYVAKLIDFDNSYFSTKPPAKSEEVVGTQEYYSPELAKYITGSEDVKAKDLTTQSDVFALGILFSEYWCGEKPITEKKYRYIWQQILDGKKISYSRKIPTVLQELIDKMLSLNPKDRPDLSKIISIFRSHEDEKLYEVAPEPEPKREVKKESTTYPEGKLKGKLLGKEDVKKEEVKTETPKLKGKLLK
jgi:serine/threonine protein kinase